MVDMIGFSKKNNLMEVCFQSLERDRNGRITIDYDILRSYIGGKIEPYHDMYILSYYNDALKLAEQGLQNRENEDEIEGSLSKLHISDLCENSQKKLKSIEYLRLGVFIANLLYYRLKSEFSSEVFVIIVSYNLKGKFKDCVVRFHKLRNVELYNDKSFYENFQSEAYGIILTKWIKKTPTIYRLYFDI